MPAAEACGALGQLLSGTAPQALVGRVDWSVLKPVHEARRRRPLLARLGAAPAPAPKRANGVRASSSALAAQRLASAPAGMRREVLVELILAEVGAVLGLGVDRSVPLDTGLFELGMDSLMSVELRKRLEGVAGRSLPSTLTFNYPSVNALASFLDAELAPPAQEAPAPPPAPAEEAPAPSDDLDALSDAEIEARLRARLEQYR